MKNNYYVLFLLLFWGTIGFSQTIPNSFRITNNEHPESEVFFIQSIGKANMEAYRLKNTDITLRFENGFTCVLESAKTLFAKGVQINPANYLESFPKEYTLPTFKIIESGSIYALYVPVGKFK